MPKTASSGYRTIKGHIPKDLYTKLRVRAIQDNTVISRVLEASVREYLGFSPLDRPYGVVYGLLDPRTNELCYVGQTQRTVKERLAEHVQGSCSSKVVAGWIQELKSQGLTPNACILGTAETLDSLIALERHHIDTARTEGHPILNRV